MVTKVRADAGVSCRTEPTLLQACPCFELHNLLHAEQKYAHTCMGPSRELIMARQIVAMSLCGSAVRLLLFELYMIVLGPGCEHRGK